jgi:hypothetical protein
MYSIHGYDCKIYGLEGLNGSVIRSIIKRLEHKYPKQLFHCEDPCIIYVFTFYIVDNKYKIAFDIEYSILPSLIRSKRQKICHVFNDDNIKDIKSELVSVPN